MGALPRQQVLRQGGHRPCVVARPQQRRPQPALHRKAAVPRRAPVASSNAAAHEAATHDVSSDAAATTAVDASSRPQGWNSFVSHWKQKLQQPHAQQQAFTSVPQPASMPPSRSFSAVPFPNLWTVFSLGAFAMLMLQFAVQWVGNIPRVRRFLTRFFWWLLPEGHSPAGGTVNDGAPENTAMVLYTDVSESVEWVNMCWRKAWRVYQRGLERWLADLLQPVFDNLVADKAVPRFVLRLRILEFTLDHEAPYFDNMRRRTSRKDSDLNGVVDVRYTGGAKLLLLIEIGQGRWRFKVPVLVSDLDLECKMWIKVRLAPMCPYLGTISLAFVGPPNIKVQLNPYNTVRLMRIPVLQAFLRKLFTVDLPGLMVLPQRLEINIPPAVTAVAEAAVGRDAVMRAVASAVLQADALEHALHAALPLGPQSPAGGIMLPDSFCGELQVTLREARNLPVGGLPWQSNPYCRLLLGNQVESSRRDDDTSHAGRHRAPVWNQEFHFLVEDPVNQVLDVTVRDSHLTGRSEVGYVRFPLNAIPPDGCIDVWLPVQPIVPGHKQEGELLLELTYKPFEDDEFDSGYREAESFRSTSTSFSRQSSGITDVKSAADASSRAAVAASAAAAAVAVTKAAAARAAARAVQLAKKAKARDSQTKAVPEKTSASTNGAKPGGNGRPNNQRTNGAPARGPGGPNKVSADRNAASSVNGVNGTTAAAAGGAAAAGAGSSWSEGRMQGLLDRVASLESLDEEEEALTRRISDAYLDKQSELLFPPASVRITDKADDDLPIGYSRAPRGPPPPPPPPDDAILAEAELASHPLSGSAQSEDESSSSTGWDSTATLSDDEDDYTDRRTDSDAEFAQPTASSHISSHTGEPARAASAGADSGVPTSSMAGMPSSSSLESAAGIDSRAGTKDAPELVVHEVEVLPALSDIDRRLFRDQYGSGDAETSFSGRASTDSKDSSSKESVTVSESTGDEGRFLSGWMSLGGWSWGNKQDSAQKSAEKDAAEKDKQKQELQEPRAEQGEQRENKGEREGGWWGAVTGWFGAGKKDGKDAQGKKLATGSTDDGTQPLSDVELPPDLDIEALAEEVQNSWKLKEVHVENLLQRALAKRERPWLVLLSVLSIAIVIMLVVVFWRLEQLL